MQAQVLTLGLLQGFMEADHQPMPGALVLETKYCENCTKSFVRVPKGMVPIEVKGGYYSAQIGGAAVYTNQEPGVVLKDTGQRYCFECQRRAIAPVDLSEYKAQLPTEAEQKHAYHLPHYDDSLVPKVAKTHVTNVMPTPPKCRTRGPSRPELKDRVRAAFAEHVKLTLEQLVDCVPEFLTPRLAYVYLRRNRIPLERVGWGDRRVECGRPPAIYALAAAVQ